MLKQIVPVYNINNFHYLGREQDCYANTLPAHLQQHPDIVATAHRHSFYLNVLFTHGTGTHEIDFTSYNVQRGSVFMLYPGQVHKWTLSDDIDGYIFFHKKEFYNIHYTFERFENCPLFNAIHNNPELQLTAQQMQATEYLYREIAQEYQSSRLLKLQKIVSLINLVYIELSRMVLPAENRPKNANRNLVLIRTFEKLLDKNYLTMKAPSDYARLLFISEKHLNKICKEFLNKTVSEIIADKIALEAKRMLVYSHLNVAEVANNLGYEDYSYFNRWFKKKTGETPLDFSKRQRSASTVNTLAV